jgi:hypothetical protein
MVYIVMRCCFARAGQSDSHRRRHSRFCSDYPAAPPPPFPADRDPANAAALAVMEAAQVDFIDDGA